MTTNRIPGFIWASVSVGIFRNMEDIEYALSKMCTSRTWDKSLSFCIQPAATLDLVTIRPSLFGGKGNMSRTEICKLGESIGLQECPQEVGPQLLIQGKVEKGIEEVFIASTEPMGSKNDVFLTISSRYGPLWLNCYVDFTEGFNSGDVWVFVKPRKQEKRQ